MWGGDVYSSKSLPPRPNPEPSLSHPPCRSSLLPHPSYPTRMLRLMATANANHTPITHRAPPGVTVDPSCRTRHLHVASSPEIPGRLTPSSRTRILPRPKSRAPYPGPSSRAHIPHLYLAPPDRAPVYPAHSYPMPPHPEPFTPSPSSPARLVPFVNEEEEQHEHQHPH